MSHDAGIVACRPFDDPGWWSGGIRVGASRVTDAVVFQRGIPGEKEKEHEDDSRCRNVFRNR